MMIPDFVFKCANLKKVSLPENANNYDEMATKFDPLPLPEFD